MLEGKIGQLDQSLKTSEDDRFVLRARLHAYQGRNGDVTEDLTSRENFAILEMEREWFERLYRKNWTKTKKRIRKDVLWTKENTVKEEDNPSFTNEVYSQEEQNYNEEQ